MLNELADYEDCTHVAMDGVQRPCRRLVGQLDYQVDKEDKAAAPIPETEAILRLFYRS